MQIEKLSETLHKFTFSQNDFSVNVVASTGTDGILLIDTGWEATAEDLKKKISELDEGMIKLIIFTHPHGDHIGGKDLLGKNATVITHKNSKDALAGKYFGLAPLSEQELPLITLDNELSLRFNGEDIEIIPASGHTNSDMVVHFVNSGVVCMGDLLFSDTFPGLFAGWGGDLKKYIETLGMLTERFPANTIFIAGHGRNYSVNELKEHLQMVSSTVALIQEGIANGKNAQEMIEDDILKDWGKWGSGMISSTEWITTVAANFSGPEAKAIVEPLTYTIIEKGIAPAIEQYHRLKTEEPEAYDFGENQLNMLGYQLLWRGMAEEAIEIHKLNIQAYPEASNNYDSLGETYEAIGETELAIESYEKALELNPEMPSAIEALKKLRAASKESK